MYYTSRSGSFEGAAGADGSTQRKGVGMRAWGSPRTDNAGAAHDYAQSGMRRPPSGRKRIAGGGY